METFNNRRHSKFWDIQNLETIKIWINSRWLWLEIWSHRRFSDLKIWHSSFDIQDLDLETLNIWRDFEDLVMVVKFSRQYCWVESKQMQQCKHHIVIRQINPTLESSTNPHLKHNRALAWEGWPSIPNMKLWIKHFASFATGGRNGVDHFSDTYHYSIFPWPSSTPSPFRNHRTRRSLSTPGVVAAAAAR